MNYFNIANINIQSIKNTTDRLTLSLREYNIDIICITEHWIRQNDNYLDNINIENYKVADYYCRKNYIPTRRRPNNAAKPYNISNLARGQIINRRDESGNCGY